MPIEIEPTDHDCSKCPKSGNCPMEAIMRDSVAFDDESIENLTNHPGLESYLKVVTEMDFGELVGHMARADTNGVKNLLLEIRMSGLVRGHSLRRNEELELMLES